MQELERFKPYREFVRTGRYRIVNISDLHMPYVSEKALDRILGSPEGDAIVVNGDVFDCSNASSYPIYQVEDFASTYGQVVELLSQLKRIYSEVFVTAGNHDARYEKMLRRNRVLAEFIDILGGCDILEKACDEAGVTYCRNGVAINKLVFFHPDNYYSVPLGTARKTLDYMIQFDGSIVGVSIGHTHAMGYAEYKGRLVFESGKVCRRLPYELFSHNLNLNNTRLGYIVFEFNGGQLESYKFVDLGE